MSDFFHILFLAVVGLFLLFVVRGCFLVPKIINRHKDGLTWAESVHAVLGDSLFLKLSLYSFLTLIVVVALSALFGGR